MSEGARCPCGCGATFPAIVAAREVGLRADAAAAPPPARVPSGSPVFLLTGMPGAGKSTVARQLAERFDRGAHVDIDLVFHHFTVSGRAEPTERTDTVRAQSELAVRNAAVLARNYVEAGFACVVEGALARRAELDLFVELVAPHPVRVVVLAPSLEVSDERDASRSGKHVAPDFHHLHDEIRAELADVAWWLDSSSLTPTQTVDAVLARFDVAVGGLRIRELVADDVDALIAMWTDRDVARNMGDWGPRDPAAVRAWLAAMIAENARPGNVGRNCAITVAATGAVAGWIGFGPPARRRPGEIDFGYAVLSAHRGRGVASTALRAVLDHCWALGVGSVYGECSVDNRASARVMEKAGMQRTDSGVADQHGFVASRPGA